jgi:hypothetical protein
MPAPSATLNVVDKAPEPCNRALSHRYEKAGRLLGTIKYAMKLGHSRYGKFAITAPLLSVIGTNARA